MNIDANWMYAVRSDNALGECGGGLGGTHKAAHGYGFHAAWHRYYSIRNRICMMFIFRTTLGIYMM